MTPSQPRLPLALAVPGPVPVAHCGTGIQLEHRDSDDSDTTNLKVQLRAAAGLKWRTTSSPSLVLPPAAAARPFTVFTGTTSTPAPLDTGRHWQHPWYPRWQADL